MVTELRNTLLAEIEPVQAANVSGNKRTIGRDFKICVMVSDGDSEIFIDLEKEGSDNESFLNKEGKKEELLEETHEHKTEE